MNTEKKSRSPLEPLDPLDPDDVPAAIDADVLASSMAARLVAMTEKSNCKPVVRAMHAANLATYGLVGVTGTEAGLAMLCAGLRVLAKAKMDRAQLDECYGLLVADALHRVGPDAEDEQRAVGALAAAAEQLPICTPLLRVYWAALRVSQLGGADLPERYSALLGAAMTCAFDAALAVDEVLRAVRNHYQARGVEAAGGPQTPRPANPAEAAPTADDPNGIVPPMLAGSCDPDESEPGYIGGDAS